MGAQLNDFYVNFGSKIYMNVQVLVVRASDLTEDGVSLFFTKGGEG